MDIAYIMTEHRKRLNDSIRNRVYTLNELAQELQIRKNIRHKYFEILRYSGILHHNNTPTTLAEIHGVFMKFNGLEYERPLVTYHGAILIKHLIGELSELNKLKNYNDYEITDKPFHKKLTIEKIEKLRRKRKQGW